jgi:hypothetical protein
MRAVLFLALLGACGRLGFDDAADAGGGSGVSYAQAVLADQPRFYYRLDEASGAVAHDATSHHEDAPIGVFGGSVTYGLPGALSDGNTAIQLDGGGNSGGNTGADVEVRTIGATWAGDFTVEMFFKETQPTPSCCSVALFLCEDYQDSGFRTGIRSDELIHLWTNEGGGTSSIHGTATAQVGVWQHLAFVKRGGTAEIYVDGAQIVAAPFDYIPTADTPQTECGFGSFHGMPAHGVYDEVAVYETALSPMRIAAHFAAR